MSHTLIRSWKPLLVATALIAGLGGVARGRAASTVVVLEDFSSMRKNGEGADLWSVYTGAGADYTTQQGYLANNAYEIKIPGNGRPYFQFMPYPYSSASGFAKYYIRSGTWSPSINRMSFWIKTTRSIARRGDGGQIAEVGVYSKPNDGQASNQGDHYYHYLDPNFVPDHWMLVTINRVPQHQVGKDSNTNWPENPTAPKVNYFDGFTRFYFCDEYGNPTQWGNGTWTFKNYQFNTVTGEPDTLVSSITAVYTGNHYELSWAGPKNTSQSYTIRYSTKSMKQNGLSTGTSAGTASNPGNAYVGAFWASPAMSEAAGGMYFAIQPSGSSSFTEVYLPTSPDYVAGATGDVPATPPPPPNLRVVP